MEKKLILVPFDFTKVSFVAINHAQKVAESVEAEIMVVHVVSKQDLLDEARTKLALLIEKVEAEYGISIKTTARVGNIFEDIGDLAMELNASFVIMGTHGLRGMQFIMGSRALRIVTSANVPFIIVQEREIEATGYDDIVVPLDLHRETKQKLHIVADMAKYFNSKVHIIIPGETDEFLRNKVDRNLTFAKRFFEEQSISCTTKISKEKSDEFDEAIINYAKELNADLIAIMNIPEISLANLVGGTYVQRIITNEEHIPALILNPKETTNASIFGAFIGGA